jgi:hypothetical protein
MLVSQLYKRLGYNAAPRQASRFLTQSSPRAPFFPATTAYTTSAMATSSNVRLSATQELLFFLPGISSQSAEKASDLLQKNHEQFHIFFNDDGFHVSVLCKPWKPNITDTLS